MIYKVKFEDIEKKQKTFRIVNLVFDFAMLAVCLGMAIYFGGFNNWENRFGATIGIAISCILPFLLELLMRKRLINTVFLVYNIYLFTAGFIGAMFNVYNFVSFYDIIIHIIMGYAVAMLGLFLLCKLKEHNKMRVITVALFCLFFSLGGELLWEVFERVFDLAFGQTSQGPVVEGTNAPLVSDTILDLICNLAGAMIFFAHYLIGKKTKYNLGIDAIEKDFSSEMRTQKNEENDSKNNDKD